MYEVSQEFLCHSSTQYLPDCTVCLYSNTKGNHFKNICIGVMFNLQVAGKVVLVHYFIMIPAIHGI